MASSKSPLLLTPVLLVSLAACQGGNSDAESAVASPSVNVESDSSPSDMEIPVESESPSKDLGERLEDHLVEKDGTWSEQCNKTGGHWSCFVTDITSYSPTGVEVELQITPANTKKVEYNIDKFKEVMARQAADEIAMSLGVSGDVDLMGVEMIKVSSEDDSGQAIGYMDRTDTPFGRWTAVPPFDSVEP